MPKNNNTTQSGVLDEDQAVSILDSTDDGADALMNRWKSDESPDDQGEEEEQENTEEQASEEEDSQAEDETDEDEGDESTDEEDSPETEAEETEADDEPETKEAPKAATDDDLVEIIVDKEARKVPLKDLKRLYGQEAALTKKSQAVAAQRKDVEANAAKYAANLDVLYKRAAAKWEPFSKVDMLIASKELDVDQFQILRKEAQEAYEEFQFVSTEADSFMKQAEAQRQESVRAKATEAIAVLKEKVPDWSDELYNKIRKYAVDLGADANSVSQIVDPYAIMMINKARMYDEAKKVSLKKKVKAPTKIIKSGNAPASTFTQDKSQATLQRLKRSGDADDAAEAFLSRWAQ